MASEILVWPPYVVMLRKTAFHRRYGQPNMDGQILAVKNFENLRGPSKTFEGLRRPTKTFEGLRKSSKAFEGLHAATAFHRKGEKKLLTKFQNVYENLAKSVRQKLLKRDYFVAKSSLVFASQEMQLHC